MRALVLAAGLGTRLRSETSTRPKALVEVGGRPILYHAITKLVGAGVDAVVVNVHHFAHQIIDYLSKQDFGVPVLISDESGQLLDTGGALKRASHFFTGSDEPVVIYNVDILTRLNLQLPIGEHRRSGALATLVVRQRDTDRYLKFSADKRLVGWVNKKSGEMRIALPGAFDEAREMAFSGIHVISPQIFKQMPLQDRFSIIDLYLGLAGRFRINGFYDTSDFWMDVGKPDQLALARGLWKE